MKITKVCCQGCGADLQIDENVRFVTCNYCHARLEVVHDETVTRTRQLDKIERTTEQLADNLRVIELQNDLERLDREWDSQRQTLLGRNSDGSLFGPSDAGVVVVLGIIWTFVAVMERSPWQVLIAVSVIVIAFFFMVGQTNKETLYESRKAAYMSRRARLLELLDQARLGRS